MKTPEEIFDEAIKAKGLDIVSVKDADLYEAGLNAIEQALSLGAVVGQSEQLVAFCRWYNQAIPSYETTEEEIVDTYLRESN